MKWKAACRNLPDLVVGIWWAVARGLPVGGWVLIVGCMSDRASTFEGLRVSLAAELGQFCRRWGYRVDDVEAEVAAALWEAVVVGCVERQAVLRRVEQACRRAARLRARFDAVEALTASRQLQTRLIEWRSTDRVSQVVAAANVRPVGFEDALVDHLEAAETVAELFPAGVPGVLQRWADGGRCGWMSSDELEGARRHRRAARGRAARRSVTLTKEMQDAA